MGEMGRMGINLNPIPPLSLITPLSPISNHHENPISFWSFQLPES